ncbi:PhzF family phenazine biosynthesis protein [Halobacillus sp. A5]|uniref:PhzF family phenazine biosynthesis protein n=1 Tax=Halobacillus sp. A5 TaxID=2880263 RepID=UPI0020A654C9|nr:PhzF family phenazine biosynthesis protein [Halobacillus sp. A5]MCP3029499.1 PhzF family phenazine biosynthesis protein [Halobacillus sp. A5]
MNLSVPFQQVDVFTAVPFQGNPVAVVLDGNNLSSEKMQNIANWTNLSETTFVCEPTDPKADYKLRIFTPNNELPFAGHPTLGSAYAVQKHGLSPKTKGRFVQESGIGLVTIVPDGDQMFITLPESKQTPIDSQKLNELAAALGVEPSNIKAGLTIDLGAVWMTLQLTDAEVVLSLRPDMEKITALTPEGVTGVTVFGSTTEGSEAAFEVRSFAPNEGVPEDPVCGSGNGCVATMVKQLQLTEGTDYVASQGSCIGRNGRVEVRFDDDGSILLGGHAVTCVEGQLNV